MTTRVETAEKMLDNDTTEKPASQDLGADHRTLFQIVAEQFLEHRMAVAGLITIAFFILVALSAPLVAKVTGLSPETQNVFHRYQPPMSRIELSLDDRVVAIENWINSHPELAAKLLQSLVAKGAAVDGNVADGILGWIEGTPANDVQKVIASSDASIKASLQPLAETFSQLHILGTDELGRDVFIRLVYGTRVSISVGILVALAAALIGLFIGSLAGFYGGVIDAVLMRVTDSLLSLPMMPVMIIFAAVDLSKLPILNLLVTQSSESILKLVVVVCLFSWMTVARLVRGSILSLKEREFVLAARTLGATDSTLILTHLLPNVLAPLLVTVTVNVGQSIIYEASLSFLGLGIQPPTPSWGNMLSNAQEFIIQAPWLALVPALLIFTTVISFNFIGDGLQSAIDPKSVKR